MTRPTPRPLRLALALAGLLTGSACSNEAVRPPHAVSIQVAPISLPDLGDACYSLTTTNDREELVWTRAGICADDFCDGRSAVTFIGPCDATDTDTTDGGTAQNTVTLVIESLWNTSGARIDEATYQNPCGSAGASAGPEDDVNFDGAGPCSVTVSCRENADVPVTFDLTVMRDAGQGFFDVAVNFEDVFCSAKLDCLQDLLHNPATGERDDTVVVGFACTSGEGTPTWLYVNGARVVCDDDDDPETPPDYVYQIDQSADADGPGGLAPGKGNLGPVWPSPRMDPAPEANLIFGVGSYRGRELFEQVDKCYWNLAIGLSVEALSSAPLGSPSPMTCRLEMEATAGQALWTDDPAEEGNEDNLTPKGWYPYFKWSVPLNTPGTPGLTCTSHPVNGEPAGVRTLYTDSAGARFDCAMACGDETLTCTAQTCVAEIPIPGGGTAGLVVRQEQATGGVVVAVDGGEEAGPYALPEGLRLTGGDASCCVDPCCD